MLGDPARAGVYFGQKPGGPTVRLGPLGHCHVPIDSTA